jgi:hypothetical protein
MLVLGSAQEWQGGVQFGRALTLALLREAGHNDLRGRYREVESANATSSRRSCGRTFEAPALTASSGGLRDAGASSRFAQHEASELDLRVANLGTAPGDPARCCSGDPAGMVAVTLRELGPSAHVATQSRGCRQAVRPLSPRAVTSMSSMAPN